MVQFKLQLLTHNLRGYVAYTTPAADILRKIPGQKLKYWCSS